MNWTGKQRRIAKVSRRRRQFILGLETLENRFLMAGLTAGNLVVERIGDGATTLGSAAAPISVLELTTAGSAVQTLTSEFTGSTLQTDSGSATSNGYMGLLGQYLAVPGYNSAVGTASVAGTNSKVGQVLDLSTGNVVKRALFPTGGPSASPPSPYSGNNFRSVIPISADRFYASGTSSGTPNTGGVWYYDGSGFTQISSTATGQLTNTRNIEIYNGQLYVSSSSGTFLGISSIGSGLPTTSNQNPTLQINTGTGSSPYGFVLFDTDNNGSVDRAYIADDRTTDVAGGLQRWDLVSGAWSRVYSKRFNTTNGQLSDATSGVVAIRGLSGTYNPTTQTVTLYATTTETSNNKLVSVIDTGTAPTTFTKLADAGTNFVFRGIDLYPATSDTTPPTVLSIEDGDSDNSVVTGEKLTYTVTFSEDIDSSTVTSADFDNAGTSTISIGNISETSPGVFSVEVTPTTAGTLILRIPIGAVIKDVAGNDLVVPVQDDTTVNVVAADTTPPTVLSIDDGDSDNIIKVGAVLNYVVSFSEDIQESTVAAADFTNNGTASIQIGTITETSPGIFSVPVTASSSGTLVLRIAGVISDLAGNNLVVPVDDDTSITVDGTSPQLLSITDNTSGATSPQGLPVTFTLTFDEDIDATSLSSSDFDNAGTSSITIGLVNESSPGVVSVVVTPTSAGTMILRIPTGATIDDVAGNRLTPPVQDDTTIAVTPVTELGPGDIAVIGYNTNGTPDSFTIVIMRDLVAGTRFFVNDNEVSSDGGTSFTDLNEGEASFTVKAGQTISAGTVITLPWGTSAVSDSRYDWSTTSGFGLGNNNEEVYLYVAPSITSLVPSTFIYGTAIGTSTSSRPNGLTAGDSFIKPTGTASRYKITGANYEGLPSAVRASIGNTASNWENVIPGAASDWTFRFGVAFTTATVNPGSTFTKPNQRSQVSSLRVQFNTAVTLQAGAFSLENIGLLTSSSSFIPQSQIVVTPSSGSASLFTITFDAGSGANGSNLNGVIKRAGGAAAVATGNSLADGNYILRIDSTKVRGENVPLIGDNAFGDVAVDRFFRMFGDSDGDGDVDGTDVNAFRLAQSAYSASMDWDGNGSVTAGTDTTNFTANRNKRRRSF
jgi:hypothetical protein